MIPPSILHQLARLRRREQLLRFTWGLTRWLTVVLGLLGIACLTDWLIDRYQDTPASLRLALLGGQIIIGVGAGIWFLVRPLWRKPDEAELALWVEEKHPALHELLISAVQFNMPGAQTGGMSLELITVVTRQAEGEARRLRFTSVVDHRRLLWSTLLAVPILAIVLVPFSQWPDTTRALLARQLLAAEDIPRLVQMASTTPPVWPSGEKGTLRFKVVGAPPGTEGEVLVYPDGLRRERYPLKPHPVEPLSWIADMPPSALNFSYRAYLGDGRTRGLDKVRYEPRPIVTDLAAFLLLPNYCGKRPDGSRFEQAQPRGDVAGISASAARVVIKTQKPITQATLEMLGETNGAVRRSIAMTVNPASNEAEGIFELLPGESGYRVVVQDEYRFANVPPPQRTVRIIPEEPPQVVLLPEYFAKPGTTEVSEEDVVEGMPFPPGGDVPIAYSCVGPYGLGQARLLFRILPKVTSGEEERPEVKWQVLPLPEVKGTEKTGPFVPRKGTFLNSGFRDQVPFHAMPSLDPWAMLGRTQGGGRYNFKTTGIVDVEGKQVELKEGDQVEFCIEVVAYRDPSVKLPPGLEPPTARSETRVKTAVSFVDFGRWLSDARREEDRLRQLDQKQRGLFEVK